MKVVWFFENAKVMKLVWFLENAKVRKLEWFLENAKVIKRRDKVCVIQKMQKL